MKSEYRALPKRLYLAVTRIGGPAAAARNLAIDETLLRIWLDGRAEPECGHLARLAELSGLDAGWLVNGQGDMEPGARERLVAIPEDFADRIIAKMAGEGLITDSQRIGAWQFVRCFNRLQGFTPLDDDLEKAVLAQLLEDTKNKHREFKRFMKQAPNRKELKPHLDQLTKLVDEIKRRLRS